MVSSTALLLFCTAWISASFLPVSAGKCTNLGFPTAYGIFECAGSNINLCAILDSTKLSNMNKLVDCTVKGLASLGYNGYLFSNLEPLIADIFTDLVNVTDAVNSLETLAHYCDSHQSESFCQVPALADATCSTPVQVNVPQDAKKDCSLNSCQGKDATSVNFGSEPTSVIKCLVSNIDALDEGDVYRGAACFIVTELTKLQGNNTQFGAELDSLLGVLNFYGDCKSAIFDIDLIKTLQLKLITSKKESRMVNE
ncbi:uncharacterized protein LOC115327566 [Ixodes scapularis]|uniref:uncharacterized protein LOC115327566 n=1 Tax=Ixodes scapularis TaxID=6945 RepID=UPI001A9FCD38|nr:uncharacterized protein LOC115327566 [Ixodes scapularis]